jgi:hypothetical protein
MSRLSQISFRTSSYFCHASVFFSFFFYLFRTSSLELPHRTVFRFPAFFLYSPPRNESLWWWHRFSILLSLKLQVLASPGLELKIFFWMFDLYIPSWSHGISMTFGANHCTLTSSINQHTHTNNSIFQLACLFLDVGNCCSKVIK